MPRKTTERPELWERERVGATLRQLREMRGLKPDDLAGMLRPTPISRSYLVNIEAGRKPLTEGLLTSIADALKVRPIVLLHPGVFSEDAQAS
jgi:transcriptional regulator with XRE-family HTH domain